MPFITGVQKYQKLSYLALSLPRGAQVSFFFILQPALFCPVPLASAQPAHPSCLCSFSSVHLYEIFDCPALFLPFFHQAVFSSLYFAVMAPLPKLTGEVS